MASNPKLLVASAIGITCSAFFAGWGMSLTYNAVPALLLPSPESPLPAPANSLNRQSPTATSKPKPATSESHLARQWQTVFNLGAQVGPAIAVSSAAAFVYASFQLPDSLMTQRRLLYVAAVLAVLIAPYTLTVMERTNAELSRRANLATRGLEEDDAILAKRPAGVDRYQTPELVRRWSVLNATRAAIPLVGIGAAIAALAL